MQNLTRGIAALLLTSAVSASLIAPTQAQRPLRLTLGVSTPVTHRGYASQGLLFGGGGDYTSTAPFLIVGISYDVTRRQEERRPVYSVYLDNGATFALFSPSATYSGLGVSARYQKTSRFYYGGGLGLYHLDSGDDSNYGSSGRNSPGAKLFVGLQGRGVFFGQLDATLLGSVNGGNLSNASLLLGLRL